jgi:hypothetical protein
MTMTMRYRVTRLQNGLTQVFDFRSKSYGHYHPDGTYEHGDLRADTLIELLTRMEEEEEERERNRIADRWKPWGAPVCAPELPEPIPSAEEPADTLIIALDILA